jgi:hypothetical protein
MSGIIPMDSQTTTDDMSGIIPMDSQTTTDDSGEPGQQPPGQYCCPKSKKSVPYLIPSGQDCDTSVEVVDKNKNIIEIYSLCRAEWNEKANTP